MNECLFCHEIRTDPFGALASSSSDEGSDTSESPTGRSVSKSVPPKKAEPVSTLVGSGLTSTSSFGSGHIPHASVAVSNAGNILAADFKGSKVWCVDPSVRHSVLGGKGTSVLLQVSHPADLAFGPTGDLFIASLTQETYTSFQTDVFNVFDRYQPRAIVTNKRVFRVSSGSLLSCKSRNPDDDPPPTSLLLSCAPTRGLRHLADIGFSICAVPQGLAMVSKGSTEVHLLPLDRSTTNRGDDCLTMAEVPLHHYNPNAAQSSHGRPPRPQLSHHPLLSSVTFCGAALGLLAADVANHCLFQGCVGIDSRLDGKRDMLSITGTTSGKNANKKAKGNIYHLPYIYINPSLLLTLVLLTNIP